MAWCLTAACGSEAGNLTNLDSSGQRLVIFGDSLTNGYQIAPNAAFPARLQQELGVPVVAIGYDGATSADGVSRFGTDVPRHNPYLVVIEFGGNDFHYRVPQDETFRNMERLVLQVQRLGAVAVLVAVDVDLMGDSYGAGYAEIARRHGAGVVTGLLNDVMTKPRFMLDPIHPNEAGHAFLAERILDTLRPILKHMPAARRARQS